jgi:sterol desaturase/sphingolipid hydroxylase (fatty acid hydroxylase superfamily)
MLGRAALIDERGVNAPAVERERGVARLWLLPAPSPDDLLPVTPAVANRATASTRIAAAGGLATVALVVAGAVALIRADIVASPAALASVWKGWWSLISDPRYLACLGALALAERLHPARHAMHNLRAGVAQDLVWFVMESFLAVTVIAAYLAVLSAGIDAVGLWWQPNLDPVIGTAGVAIAAFVVGDLAAWWSHWLHHRVPQLWSFHAVHHSQTAMNVLSDNREHIVETIVNATLTFLPARLLGLDAASASALTFAVLAFSAFIHANIRTDLGPLRYVFISPQAHRVHHSIRPEHHDTNFGTVLACWDLMFGTRNPERHDYPDTGVADAAFPLEQRCDPVSLVRTWLAQTAYPFRGLARRAPVR